MFINKYPEKDINWNVIGLEEYNKIKNIIKPDKETNLHSNNLLITKFKPGC